MKINVKSISILLNILFLCGGLYLIYFFKDKIIKKIESKKQFDVVLYGDSLIEDFEWQPKNREIKLTNIGYGGITTSELVWYIKDSNDKQRQQIKEINNQHSSEMSGITEALNNNTLVIQKLCDKMDLINKEV